MNEAKRYDPNIDKAGYAEVYIGSVEQVKNNCGIGSEGFEPGNTCAKGGGGGDVKTTGETKYKAHQVYRENSKGEERIKGTYLSKSKADFYVKEGENLKVRTVEIKRDDLPKTLTHWGQVIIRTSNDPKGYGASAYLRPNERQWEAIDTVIKGAKIK